MTADAAKTAPLAERLLAGDKRALARAITLIESDDPAGWELVREVYPHTGKARIVGFTGPPGVGKSTLIGALTAELRKADRQVSVLSIDPSSPFTRGALLGVSPALRQAALGMGASKTQMVFHHVLPVTFPSILTATILGVAHAVGETAPLLLIGMKAFVAQVPTTPFDQATALPVQIYLWQGNENRNFFEPRTAAAIMVLLAVMILLNGAAIFLRSRLEKRA